MQKINISLWPEEYVVFTQSLYSWVPQQFNWCLCYVFQFTYISIILRGYHAALYIFANFRFATYLVVGVGNGTEKKDWGNLLNIRGVPKNWLIECCWNHDAQAKSPVAGTPVVWKNVFWSFLTKTKQAWSWEIWPHSTFFVRILFGNWTTCPCLFRTSCI